MRIEKRETEKYGEIERERYIKLRYIHSSKTVSYIYKNAFWNSEEREKSWGRARLYHIYRERNVVGVLEAMCVCLALCVCVVV